jgi:hypothetical protein
MSRLDDRSWAQAEELRPGCGAEWDVIWERVGPPPIPDDVSLCIETANSGLYAYVGPIRLWYRPSVGWVRSGMAGRYDYAKHGLDPEVVQPRVWAWFMGWPAAPWDKDFAIEDRPIAK